MQKMRVKVVVAPDSFKESLTALEAAESIKTGLARVWPDAEYTIVPMADGGEGTVQSLVDATGGQIIKQEVAGPMGTPVPGFFGLLGNGKTAVIEMAAASGLHYVSPADRNPLIASSWGVGDLIRAALHYGAKKIILGLGGSATNDGGSGMVQALGAKLLNGKGQPIAPGGAALSDLSSIDLSDFDPRIADTEFEIATDVTNPLTGPVGASAVFGPQKGASRADVRLLDEALQHYASIVRRDLGRDIDQIPGAGAAGGLGAAAIGFLRGSISPGIDLVIRSVRLAEKVKNASLVITGEGKIDNQTIYGKTPIGVARCAKQSNIPVIAVAGTVSPNSRAVYEHGIDALFPIVPGAVSLDDALKNARENLARTAENIARVWNLSAR